MNFDLSSTFVDRPEILNCFNNFHDYSARNFEFWNKGVIKSKFLTWSTKLNSERVVKKKFPEVWKAQVEARKDGGLSGDYQWMRLSEIYKLKIMFDFQSVLEFGTGGSTRMFSELVGAGGTIDSFEESEFWYKRTREITDSRKNLNLHLANRQVLLSEGEVVVKYEESEKVYKENYDLIYIDGPTTKLTDTEISELGGEVPDKKNQTAAAIDIRGLFESGGRPKLIVVDGKRPTVRWIFRNWENEYALFPRTIYIPYPKRDNNFRYHSIFLRRDLLK